MRASHWRRLLGRRPCQRHSAACRVGNSSWICKVRGFTDIRESDVREYHIYASKRMILLPDAMRSSRLVARMQVRHGSVTGGDKSRVVRPRP
jgi:hypothetical protein